MIPTPTHLQLVRWDIRDQCRSSLRDRWGVGVIKREFSLSGNSSRIHIRRGSNSKLSSLYEGFAYVLVGPERQKFGFHRGILCQYSSFFRAALLGNFREAEEGLVVLPDDDPSTFKIFNTWLYSRRIRGQLQNGKEVPCEAIELVKLFIFGDMRGIPALRNDVIDAFVKERSTVHLEVIPYLYANTQPSSPLRRLFVDLINWQFEMSMDEKGVFRPDRGALAYFVPEFMMELLIAREKIKRPISMWTCPFLRIRCSYREYPLKTERCTVSYHEHPEEEARNPRGF